MALMEASDSANPSNSLVLIGENYELHLKQSIQDVLAEARKEEPEFSPYVDAFYRLMQAKVDPRFESVWLYAALSFPDRNFSKSNSLDRISAAKDLFQLVSSCSASCSPSKSIALLVPVIFEVYKVVQELFGKELGLQGEKKAMMAVKSLVDGIIGYISVNCSTNYEEESDSSRLSFITPLKDLVGFWVDSNEGVESILPLVSCDLCCWLNAREFDMNYLAGTVIMEVFCLKVCLYFTQGTPRDELEKLLKSWAVGSISGFQNIYFFEILVRMMLDMSLPPSFLLTLEDRVLLKKVLFDAVILVDYSFLYNENAIHLTAENIRSIAVMRLILMHVAIEFFRGCGEQNKAISYTKAFSSSRLPSHIIEWVIDQTDMEKEAARSKGSSPKALINWLLSLNKKIHVLDNDALTWCSKLDIQAEQPSAKLEVMVADDNLQFFIDKAKVAEEDRSEEDQKNELMTFVDAAHIEVTENRSKKRKGGSSARNEVKFVKYDFYQNPHLVKPKTSIVNDEGSSGESEVEDPLSGEDTDASE